MANLSNEVLARQIGDAFAAAFPDAAAFQAGAHSESQPTQVTTPGNKRTSCTYCGCDISDFLTAQLRKGLACPACTANAIIKAIEQVQQRLTDRGGAFASKLEANGHKTKWEALIDDAHVLPEDLTNVKSALAIWDSNKIALSKVPGLKYIEGVGEGEPTAEEHEVARLMIELLRLILEKEMRASDREAQGVSRKKKEVGLSGDRKPLHSSIHGEHTNRDEAPEAQIAIASSRQRTPPAPDTLKSILKRKASFTISETPPQKRTRIADVVTVSPPRLNVSNPSPFIKLPDTVTTQTHAKHTSAQQNRPKDAFKRSAPDYAPGVWASGAFEEKAGTSNFKSNWNRMEKQVAEELQEAAEVQTVFKGIKMVTGTWMGMWWVRKVTRHLDLEQLWERLGKK
ncbi:hypothetical protein DE146DRAFT_680017 [Phaeosphaeria sp. MPI-PUGE-AT-0046c]|nr:hypothetical protein DE146DRAFT_680017 [Phaeosphaeria sp. MPI-PUGE-AT-0046c]